MASPRYSIIPGDALDDPKVTDLHLRVLALLGRHSDNNGWLQINQRTLAEKTGRSRETINRAISDLVDLGYVRKEARFSEKDGRQMISSYQIIMDRSTPSPSSRRAQPDVVTETRPCDPHVTGGCDAHVTGGVMSGDHTPCDLQTSHHNKEDLFFKRSISSSHEEDGAPRASAAEQRNPRLTSPRDENRHTAFDAWYATFPHKVGVAAARRAFDSALRKASLETLIDGVRAYVASKPPDRPYCNPATWLNQERWLDSPASAVPTQHQDRARSKPMDPLFAVCGAELSNLPKGDRHAIEQR
jgi:hypothetical protein